MGQREHIAVGDRGADLQTEADVRGGPVRRGDPDGDSATLPPGLLPRATSSGRSGRPKGSPWSA